jgi:SNF2 family DNA or RNA helicase
VSATLDVSSVYGTPIFTLRIGSTAVKTAFGAVYHGPTQSWRFPAFYPVHQSVLSDLRKIVPGLTLTDRARAHVEDIEKPVEFPPDFSFITPPYQHQRDGVLHLYRYMRAGLFYSPGLGKCKITVDYQRLTGTSLLILCPRVMLYTWQEEFEKHGNIKDVVVIDAVSKAAKTEQIKAAAAQGPVATVITYSSAERYVEELIKVPYSTIVADESHQMKSPFAKRTKAAEALASRAARRVLLSGTPSLGSPFDMYGQLRFLGKYFNPEDWWAFRKVFGVYPQHEASEKVPKMLLGYKNLELMNARVNRVCLRKTKEECLDLPDQQIIDRHFVLTAAQKKVYNDLIMERCDAAGWDVKQKLEEGTLNQSCGTELIPYVIADEQITLMQKLDQASSGFLYKTKINPGLCNGCDRVRKCSAENIAPYTNDCTVAKKAPATAVVPLASNARQAECAELVEQITQDPNNKVIIWASLTAELDDLEKICQDQELDYVRIEGGVSTLNLKIAMDRFNKDPKCRVYIGQVSTGIGITLNAGNYTIYYSLPWNLEHYLQSLDRNYRIGQSRKVTVYRLLARHTVDEAKAAALDQKIDFSNFITMRSICAVCPEYARRCSKYNVQLYDAECKYDRTMVRVTAKIGLIP